MSDKKSGFLSDYRASEDGLNFGIFKPALRNILQTAETPLTVGVFGTWGSGKTSLLNMLKDELDAKNLPSLKTVWFTAWKYEQHDALWRAFMLRVVDGLHPRKEDGTRYQPDDFSTPAEKPKLEALLHLGRLERNIYETVSWQDEGQWSLNTGELVKQGSKLPIWLAFHLSGLGGAAKDLGLNPDMAKLLEREVREHHLNQLSYMEQFATEFQKAVQLILGDDGRLVVFVDDLDRCLPEKAVEVLEAIKLFLDVPGTVFVLGMDREVIRRGIETHYGAMLKTDGDDEIPINGDVYLQKLVQIPFNLPPLDMKGRIEFIQTLEKGLPSDYHLDSVTREIFARGLYPNPRQVKRALNVFYLLKQIVIEQERQMLIPVGFLSQHLLAKTVLIQNQWPELYKIWRQYPTLIQTLEDEYIRQPISEEEILRGRAPDDNFPAEKDNSSEQDNSSQHHSMFRPIVSGLMAPFLNERQRYSLLAEMLRFPDTGELDGNTSRARFGGLKRTEMQTYVGLLGSLGQTTQADQALNTMVLSENWLRDLESGDPVKIREIIAAMNERDIDHQSVTYKDLLRKNLVNVAQNDGLALFARVTAADIADELGYVPDDLFSFVPVGQVGNTQSYIGRYPVTNLQYKRFLDSPDFSDTSIWTDMQVFDHHGNLHEDVFLNNGLEWLEKECTYTESKIHFPIEWKNPSFGIQHLTNPVVGISWWEASAYCKWLTAHFKELPEFQYEPLLSASCVTFRLPTEKEWVLAAGGEENGRFAFGEQGIRELPRFANTSESKLMRTTPVWMYRLGVAPSGAWDMTGNVWEWQANYHDNEQHGSITLRGGSWDTGERQSRVSYRINARMNNAYNVIGFRVMFYCEAKT